MGTPFFLGVPIIPDYNWFMFTWTGLKFKWIVLNNFLLSDILTSQSFLASFSYNQKTML